MNKLSIAAIALASFAAFAGVARADETVTAENQETARVARESAGVFIGGQDQPHVVLGYAERASANPLGDLTAPAPAPTAADRAFLKLGNRGIGIN